MRGTYPNRRPIAGGIEDFTHLVAAPPKAIQRKEMRRQARENLCARLRTPGISRSASRDSDIVASDVEKGFEENMFMRKILAVMVFAAFAVSIGRAQAPAAASPDLSGTWKVDIAKSDFGQMPPPSAESEVITQNGNDFKFEISSENDYGNRHYAFNVKADGTDTPFPSDALPPDSPLKILSTSAQWQGSSLVVTQKTSFQDDTGSLKATYSLSPDGKQLSKDQQFSFSQGDFESKVVFDKQ
jgi:hypothetical protein